MTSFQKLYSALFLFGPPVILSIYKEWWLGVVAFVVSFILSMILTFTVSLKLSPEKLKVWAWVKPALIGFLLLYAGFNFF